MYLPKQFNHPEHARSIILENPFASLVSNDDEGFPFISHIPIKLMPHAQMRNKTCCWVMLPKAIPMLAFCTNGLKSF